MTSPLSLHSFDAIVFDLGGVILPLFPERTIAELSRLYAADASVSYPQTKQHPLFDQFERGELGRDAFRTGMHALFERTAEISDADFDEAYSAMLGVLPDENLELISALGKQKRVFLLSNTNEIHIARFSVDYRKRHLDRHGQWSALFEQAHYSHLLGMRKPEPRIFRELVLLHKLEPHRTVFLDDNLDNVQAAQEAGFLAHHHPTNTPLSSRFPSFLPELPHADRGQ